MDRFTYTEQSLDFICNCNGNKCREKIHVGDECYQDEFGDYYCSPECFIWAHGGNKVYAGIEALV